MRVFITGPRGASPPERSLAAGRKPGKTGRAGIVYRRR